MMKRQVLVAIGALASQITWSQIAQPHVGVMLDQNGAARPVMGVAASATLGSPWLSGVVAMACSEAACLAKTASQIVSTAGSTADAPAGPALFGGSYIYFPQTQQLMRWHAGILDPIAFNADGTILALRPNEDGIDYAVIRDGATWIEEIDGNGMRILASFAQVNAAMLTASATLLAADDGVHSIAADGTDTIIGVAGVQAFIQMSDRYVELVTAQGMWALDLTTGSVTLLPGVAP